jgi:hypothetical protein
MEPMTIPAMLPPESVTEPSAATTLLPGLAGGCDGDAGGAGGGVAGGATGVTASKLRIGGSGRIRANCPRTSPMGFFAV